MNCENIFIVILEEIVEEMVEASYTSYATQVSYSLCTSITLCELPRCEVIYL